MKRYLIAAALLGLGANGAVALSAPPTETVTLGAKPDLIVFGRTTTLSGQLTSTKPAGKRVDLQADFFPYEGKFVRVAQATTAANGAWTAAVKPPINARFRAHKGKANSPAVTVRVRIRVSLKFSDRTPKAGRLVRFSGRACPQHDGALVGIQRRTRTKKWRTVRRTRLRDLAGSSCSRFSKRLRVRRDGSFRALVVAPDGDHVNGRSARHRIDAHR